VRHGETVLETGVGARGVWVRSAEQRISARFLIDATGQGRLTARRSGSVRPFERFGRAAVFTHFEGLSRAALDELAPSFDVRIVLRQDGWGWVIPLPGARLSVGLVGKQHVTADTLQRGLLAGPLVSRLTHGAKRLATRTVDNFSYANTEPVGPRFATVGDASSFLDPVFSSGVTLALRGAEGLADVLATALDEGTEAAPDLLAQHVAAQQRALNTFAALIGRFYDGHFLRSLFLGESLGFELRRGVLSVLAGDVWRQGNPFQDLLLAARRTEGACAWPRSASAQPS
jgi:flavin-dependent dehydrogenase